MMSFLSLLKQKDSDTEGREVPRWIRALMWTQKRWWKTVMIIGVIIGITQTAGFTAFIIEEKQQQLGFGVFAYQQMKQYPKMLESAEWCLSDAKRDLRTLKLLNWFNPITGWSFVNYGEANIRKLQWQIDSVETRLNQVEVKLAKLEKEESFNSATLASVPDNIADVKPQPARPVFPIATANGGLRYPKQIDYITAAQRHKQTENLFYITRSGARYHRKTCRSVRGREGVRALTKEEALREGKTPCKRCKP